MDTLVHVGLTNALLAAILALAVAGLTGFFRRRPAVVHGLWVLVLIKFLVPSFYPVEIPRWGMPANLEEHSKAIEGPQASASLSPEPIIPATPAQTLEQQAQDAAQADQPELIGNFALEAGEDPIPPPPALPRIQLSWEKWLGLAWLSGSLLLTMVALTRVIRFRRLLSHARPADRQLQSRLAYLAERLGVSAYPAISLVAAPIPPLLWALSRKPRLLLPDTLWERLSMEQQDTLLLHELAHLRRGDHWVRRLELAVLAIYWWHPVVWWAMRNLRETEEQCCDAWVVWALPMSGHSYAVALVETLEFLSQSRPLQPLGASGIEPMRLLKRRLSMIVREQTPRAMPRWAFCAVALLGAALLPLLPIPAQQPGSDEGEDAASQSLPGGNQPAQFAEQPLPGFPSMQPDRSEQIEAARDQIELIEAKVMIKRAEIEEMNLRIRQAQRNLQRLEELYKKGVLEESALNKARNEAELLPTQLPIKKAELAEVEVGLKQAMRRLSRLENNPGPSMGMGMPLPTMRPAGKAGMSSMGSGMGRPGMMGPEGPPPGAGGHGRPETIGGAPPGGALPGASQGGPGIGLAGASTGAPGSSRGPAGSSIPRGAGAASSGVAGPGGMIGGMGTMGGPGGPPPGAMSTGSASGGSGMMGGPGGKAGEGASTPAWANRLFEERSWNFGTVRRGEAVGHLFQLINTLDQPVHVASVRTSASFVKAFPMVTLAQMGGAQSRQTQAWIGPYQSVAIEVEMDTRRFTGDKMATVYVQFDQPAPAEVRLQVHARSLEPPAGINDKAEPKARILELEVKVDQLLKEIGALRDELKQRPGKPPGGGAGPTPGPEAGDSTKP